MMEYDTNKSKRAPNSYYYPRVIQSAPYFHRKNRFHRTVINFDNVIFLSYRYIVFFLLDKGHEAENLQKECLFLLHYHFPMADSSESLGNNLISETIAV